MRQVIQIGAKEVGDNRDVQELINSSACVFDEESANDIKTFADEDQPRNSGERQKRHLKELIGALAGGHAGLHRINKPAEEQRDSHIGKAAQGHHAGRGDKRPFVSGGNELPDLQRTRCNEPNFLSNMPQCAKGTGDHFNFEKTGAGRPGFGDLRAVRRGSPRGDEVRTNHLTYPARGEFKKTAGEFSKKGKLTRGRKNVHRAIVNACLSPTV